ncbi:MAG TPA: ADP-ribosylglycohydrolase family protein [Candidatus Krumholzibacteria bacterium]|nr:ADP-ribosylglycohydrolase family protein [Candidatus Krumholzibacteria bacterium]
MRNTSPKPSHRTTLVSRAQGALMGQIVGDALGSGVDGWSPERIRDAYPGGVRQMIANPDLGTLAGQITEKSEMALVLARVLVDHHEYDAALARSTYVRWLNSGVNVRDFAVTGALLDNAVADSNSNSALLRVAPLGIFGARIWPGVVELWAQEDGVLTHANPVCLAANELFAVAIATAVRQPMAPRALFESITDYAETTTVLRDTIRRARQAPPPDYLEFPEFVTVALHNALWQLTHVPSFEEALVHTIAHGGDASGNAAACGALLGAVYGLPAIPKQWVKAVLDCKPEAGRDGVTRARPHEYWAADALELGEKLVSEHPQVAATEESSV